MNKQVLKWVAGIGVSVLVVLVIIGNQIAIAQNMPGMANQPRNYRPSLYSPTQLMVQVGTVTTSVSDGRITNTFSPAFGSRPLVVLNPVDSGGYTITTATVTTTAFILQTLTGSRVIDFHAIGAP